MVTPRGAGLLDTDSYQCYKEQNMLSKDNKHNRVFLKILLTALDIRVNLHRRDHLLLFKAKLKFEIMYKYTSLLCSFYPFIL